MHSLFIRALGLCLLMFFINALKAEEIDWVYESFKSGHAIAQEYDDRLTHKLVHDNFAPGFVAITPSGIIEGDFDALEEDTKNKEHTGHFVTGPPQVVATCENTAVVWKTLTFYDKECKVTNGTMVMLYEYTDGKAMIKLMHSTM